MSIQDAIAENYGDLSERHKAAADYVSANPFDVATRSLRSIASTSGISPATFSRLARALGYDGYENLREESRLRLERQVVPFSEKARQLRDESQQLDKAPLLQRQSAACIANIESLTQQISSDRVDSAVDCLEAARQVVLIGALGSFGFADYWSYLTGWFSDKWRVVGRNGLSLGPALARLRKGDAVVIITKSPFAKRAVRAADIAAEAGADVIVITDSHAFPGLAKATHGFVVQTESPQFFSSYAATLVLIEVIVGMLVARAGPEAETSIQEVASHNHRLEEF
ncbi:MAG: MurR/RpiR family transcriptional regulator [Alphaproteobacteria bacterium]|nr:MurR/RpiR family transcriptional regulator [Alphaproteobacteria bacterium]